MNEESIKKEEQQKEKTASSKTPAGVILGENKCCHCDEYLNGWKRARADYENLKREMQTREKSLGQFLNFSLLSDILPVVNHFKLAQKFVPEAIQKDPWYRGMEGIQMSLQKFLKDQGVEEIKTMGQKFHPEFHESLGEVEGGVEGTIAEEIEGGFLLHGRVLRPAKVKIYKKMIQPQREKGGEK